MQTLLTFVSFLIVAAIIVASTLGIHITVLQGASGIIGLVITSCFIHVWSN